MKNIAGMVKLGAILAAFAAAACVMLAFVYTGTKGIIEKRTQEDQQAALQDIFPEAEQFDEVQGIKSPDPSVTITGAFEAKKDGETLGAALTLLSPGYGGPISIMAGVDVEGTITGVKILAHSETPGLGANASSPSYYVDRSKGTTFFGQFTGKNAADPFAVKNDVAVITASTVTSRAIAQAVKAAGVAVTSWLSGVEADIISGATTGAVQ